MNNIRVLSKSKTGRVLKVKVFGPSGENLISGRELRQRLGLKSTLARFEMIPYKPEFKINLLNQLQNFQIRSIPPPLPRSPEQYSLLVKGFGAGHGVGMSQWGAHGMASKGADFRMIIKHYYSGVKVLPY